MTLQTIKAALQKAQDVFSLIQDFVSVKGSLYVDAFAVVVLVRLAAPLWGKPSMTLQEAGLWGVTIAAFAATNINGKGA